MSKLPLTLACDSVLMSSAAAPSLIGELEAAVLVPPSFFSAFVQGLGALLIWPSAAIENFLDGLYKACFEQAPTLVCVDLTISSFSPTLVA